MAEVFKQGFVTILYDRIHYVLYEVVKIAIYPLNDQRLLLDLERRWAGMSCRAAVDCSDQSRRTAQDLKGSYVKT